MGYTIKALYEDTHTLNSHSLKLNRQYADEKNEEVHKNFSEIAPLSLNILTNYYVNVDNRFLILAATRDHLDIASFRIVV